MKIKNKIGSLRNRIEQRIGRPFGRCDSCAKPTRSHKVGGGLVCHDCHTPHQQRLVTDGGWQTENEQGDTHGAEGCDSNGTATWSSAARMSLVESVREWLNRNDPLARSEFDDINSTFIREAGKAINHPKVGENEQIRVTTGEEAGLFAAEHDTVIYETKPQQSVGFAELMGLPVSDGWVPVLVCGPIRGEIVKEDFHDAFHHLDDLHEWFDEDDVLSAVDRRAIPDGGEPMDGDEIPKTMQQRDEWFNFILPIEEKDNGETKINKWPVAPYKRNDLYRTRWTQPENRTDFETVNKFASLGREAVGRLNRPNDAHLAEYKLGLGYPIPKADYRDPSESITLIDLDDVRDPDDGALHPRAIELIAEADSFAQVSSSGTGIHIIVIGALPDDVSTIDDSLPDHDAFPDAEIEVYDNGRFIAMTGDRVEGTPTEVYKREPLLADLADEFDASESNSDSDDFDYEPEFSKDHVSNVGSTDNMQEVFDAIHHTDLTDIRFKSTITEKRSDGSVSMDPSWANSESGTRLVHFNDNDGPAFNYRKGDIGFDVLKFVALEERIISNPSASLEGEDFWKALEELRKRGADIPKIDQTKGMLNQAVMWPEIHREDATPTITRENHYDLVYREAEGAMAAGRNVLINAVMSSGKTYNSFKAAFDRGEQMGYFAPRRDLCEQAKQYALEVGYDESDILVLPSLFRDCPAAAGEHGSEWESKIKKQYEQDATPGEIHKHNDNIPCHDHDDDGKTCPYKQFWKDHDIEDYAVVIGHHKHANLQHVTMNRANVFDEDPSDSFTAHIGGEQLIRGINAFLDMDGSPPIDDFTELLEIRNGGKKKRRAEGWFNNHDFGSEGSKVIDNYEQGYHAKAPHAVYAILKAQPRHEGSNFEHAYMLGFDNHAQVFTTSEQNGEFYVEIRNTPDLDRANSIIALDGTPLTSDSDKFHSEVPEWSKALGVKLDHEKILNDEERATYLTDTLNHTYINTTSALKPYSSGRYNNAIQDEILCREVTERHGNGKPPVVVSSKKVCDEYESRGFVDDGIVDDFEYPGNLRGSNEYADTRVAIQLGSSHHGDHEIARRAAWLGAPIDPEGHGRDRDYGSEEGNKVLEQMREQQTLQNILRFGRDGGGATVILHTSAYPDWLPIAGHGKIDSWSEGMREVVEAWQDLPAVGVTAADVADHDAVSVSDRRVRSLLSMLAEEHGLVEQEKGEGANGAHLYADAGVKDLERTETAEVDLPEIDDEELAEMGLLDDDGEPVAESVEISRYSINTSDFRIHGSEGGGLAVKTGCAPDRGVAEGGDGAQRE